MSTKKKSATNELVIHIKDAKLRQRIEDKARRYGSTPEAVVNEVLNDLETAWRTIRLYMTQVEQLHHEMGEQRRQQEKGYLQIEEALKAHQQRQEEFEAQRMQQQKKFRLLLEQFVVVARSWKDSAEKAIGLCEKYAVKVGYFNTVRRQRDELLGLVERFLVGKTVRPDEVGEIYAIAHSGLIDRMINRIEITAPPEVAPFNPDPSLFAGD